MNNKGFTLIETLVVMVIIGILIAISVIGYIAVKKGIDNKIETTRLLEFAQAQEKFRISGNRTYATLKELCQAGLLSDNVVKMDADCNTQEPINGFIITPGTETSAYLQNHFFAKLNFQSRPSGEVTPAHCVGQDGVMRVASNSALDDCTITSAVYKP